MSVQQGLQNCVFLKKKKKKLDSNSICAQRSSLILRSLLKQEKPLKYVYGPVCK